VLLEHARSGIVYEVSIEETHYTYTPSDARAARALCFDDVRAERAPWVCGVHGGLGGALGVHVAHFHPMCLTAWNSPRHPTSPITPRTGPTGFDVRSSRGGRPERTLGEHPHVLGARVISRSGVVGCLYTLCSGIQKITGGLGSLSI